MLTNLKKMLVPINKTLDHYFPKNQTLIKEKINIKPHLLNKVTELALELLK